MSMRTPLGRVRGLGSAKSGTGAFVVQRVSSIALAILVTLFVILVVMLVGQPYQTLVATIAAPFWTFVLIAGILVTVVHMRVGMQVIIEDYIHAELPKLAALIGNWLFSWGVGLVATFAVLKIAFGA